MDEYHSPMPWLSQNVPGLVWWCPVFYCRWCVTFETDSWMQMSEGYQFMKRRRNMWKTEYHVWVWWAVNSTVNSIDPYSRLRMARGWHGNVTCSSCLHLVNIHCAARPASHPVTGQLFFLLSLQRRCKNCFLTNFSFQIRQLYFWIRVKAYYQYLFVNTWKLTIIF